MKVGVIDVGGGSRDIFGAGVFDYCLDHGITFDYCLGISAGSANLANFLSGQRGRNYVFYTDYFFRKEYSSVYNLLTKKNYVDLDYIYSTLSNSDGENPFDYEAFTANPVDLIIGSTDAETAEPVYFTKKDMTKDSYDAMKASSCLPVICRAYAVDGRPCFDGGLSNPIPVRKALAEGCDKVVLILTRPKHGFRKSKKDLRFAKVLRHSYPAVAKALENRAALYNSQLRDAIRLEREGRVLILAPDDIMGMGTLTKDREKLRILYEKGMNEARKLSRFLEV